MAIHIPDNLDKYVICADGFLPSTSRMKSLLSIDNPRDGNYLERFGLRMSETYHEKLKEEKAQESASLYLMNPQDCPRLIGKYNPIQDEFGSINDNKENYRLLLMMINGWGEPQALKDAFRDTLSNLEFKVRAEGDFKDIPRFRGFVSELSEGVVERHVAPYMQVEKDMKQLGLDSENTFIT